MSKPFNLQILNSWAETNNADKLIILILSELKQLKIVLDQNFSYKEWINPLMKSISRALTAQNHPKFKKQLLEALCTTKLFEHWTMYITDKLLTDPGWSEAEEFFKSCLNIVQELLNELPQHSIKCVTAMSNLLDAVKIFEEVKDNRELLNSITLVLQKAKETYTTQKEKDGRPIAGNYMGNNDSDKPPDDFRLLSIVPSEEDLREDAKPFIRSAKIEGGYEDVHHYLDVQFRLLRQDFIHPLKEGITELKKKHFTKLKSSDLRIYKNVRIIAEDFTYEMNHILQYDISDLIHVKWDTSKRFMFNSLLCLSKDNFQTVLFATVANRDPAELASGYVTVSFKTGLGEVFRSTPKDVYVMAETTAYFESYCHVLEGLQKMSHTMPLQDYIIKCNKSIKPPKYLLHSSSGLAIPKYDLTPLMKTGKSRTEKIAVLTTVRWPNVDVMCLNESQREAAQLALTKELAIIQGPPGTGKTYVGLKVMQVLIENKCNIRRLHREPILVVCYTNHALDQFLEGVLKFCSDGIVRVGGKSKSSILEVFNLRNIRKRFDKKENMWSDSLTKLSRSIRSLKLYVKSETELKTYIRETHFESLTSEIVNPQCTNSIMSLWLQLSSDSIETEVSEIIKSHLTKLILHRTNIPRNTELTDNMNVIQRAGFYHHNLKKYISKLIMDKRDLLTQPPSAHNTRSLKEIEYFMNLAESQILPDQEMEAVLAEEDLDIIYSFLTSSKDFQVPVNACFETWLLGLNKGLQSQLDDIQILTVFGKKSKKSLYECMDEIENLTGRAKNDLLVDDDDDIYNESHNARIKDAMNDITSLMQRAIMLGIKLDFMEDNDDYEDEDNWHTVSKPLKLRQIYRKLRLIKPMSTEEELKFDNIWEMNLDQRFSLYNLWTQRYLQDLTCQIDSLVDQYKIAQEELKKDEFDQTVSILQKALVIGMTTTGAAKYRSVLQEVGCRIIVVEEAAEVLESHIVTSLNKNCQQLILIGDHQQLRPSPIVYQLAKDFGLEISLFERLIKNKVPHVMLMEQHRMRPEISKIMRHIYPDLQDHPSVAEYENIRGVSKNVFFISHENEETQMDDSMSKSNIHEAMFIVKLCQYLLNQGYSPTRITILATYAGQVSEIMKTMRKCNINPKVVVTSVDNFQGEENDIILLSLVRSNKENNVGFLKVDNRVCVALSRAKKGLFAIGNFKLLASKSKLWRNVIKTAKSDNITGDGLPVVCPNHPDWKEVMRSEEDFSKCPEGGCGTPCEFRLQCGHMCTLTCHGYDLEHQDYKCHKPCPKKCEVGHLCAKMCCQPCEDCEVVVIKQIPMCEHEVQVPCYIQPDTVICPQRCAKILPCDHQCYGKCGQCRRKAVHEKCLTQVEYTWWSCEHTATVPCYMRPSEYPCQKLCGADLECGHTCTVKCSKTCAIKGEHSKCFVPVTYTWPCGHNDTVPCYVKPSLYLCHKNCGATLDCGHKCAGNCFECLEGAVHVACEERCDKSLPCGHTCSSFCSVQCLPCKEERPRQCRHEMDKKQPSVQLCGSVSKCCTENCMLRCRHGSCNNMCYENCDLKPCNIPCNKVVTKCGHKCSGLCGELCVCRECEHVSSVLCEMKEASEEVDNGRKKGLTSSADAATDTSLKKSKKTMSKNKNPKGLSRRLLLKIPSCKHIFYVDELDTYISNFQPQSCSYILCPVCQCPILTCTRYENINKKRSKKRNAEKAKLNMKTNLSDLHKSNLLKSLKKLQNSTLLKDFQSFDVTVLKDQIHLKAVSFKIKCGFVLSIVDFVMKRKPESNSKELVRSRVESVLKVQNKLTSQQKSEFTVEMLRCLWLSYLENLSDIAPEETNTEVKDIILLLNNSKPSSNTFTKAKEVSDSWKAQMTNQLTSAAAEKLHILDKLSLTAINVIKSNDETGLHDLIDEEADRILQQVKSAQAITCIRIKTFQARNLLWSRPEL